MPFIGETLRSEPGPLLGRSKKASKKWKMLGGKSHKNYKAEFGK